MDSKELVLEKIFNEETSNEEKVKLSIEHYHQKLLKLKERELKLKVHQQCKPPRNFSNFLSWQEAEMLRCHMEEAESISRSIKKIRNEINELGHQIGKLLPIAKEAIKIKRIRGNYVQVYIVAYLPDSTDMPLACIKE